ncbi:MAG TPA: PadR family transcriptional regulator [Gemmatimonadaceae bacterium]|jgi:DNA-binding PadR family transcriptional regulator
MHRPRWEAFCDWSGGPSRARSNSHGWGDWGGWEGFGDWGGGQSRGRARWRGRAARLFEQGDLKYVILRLLEEKPRHGYDIIKELESRFGGSYAPSPGTVYPTLTMLEDLGYARVVPEEGGKKIYEITDEGRKHLAEHSTTVDDIFARIARFVEGFTDTPMTELNQQFQRLARATYRTATTHMQDRSVAERIRDILRDAADQIEAVAK